MAGCCKFTNKKPALAEAHVPANFLKKLKNCKHILIPANVPTLCNP
jgi:hypothetical protein